MDLLVAGDVQTILQGLVTPESLHSVPVKSLPYALGGAALPHPGPLEVGETISYEGTGHIFTVKEAYTATKALHAAFLMGIERKPKDLLKISKQQTINELYEDLMKTYPNGFALVGEVYFSKLSVAYLQLSPIYEENINVLRDKYWKSESFQNRECKLFGVALKKPDPRAFYNNPNDTEKSSLSSHSHVLAPFARHLLTDSELDSGTIWIEEIDDVKSYSD